MSKKMKIVLIIVLVLVVIVLAACIVMGNYLYNLALNPNSSKEFMSAAFETTEDNSEYAAETEEGEEPSPSKEVLLEWAKGIYTKWSIVSFDDLHLNGYYYESETESNKYAILVHGYMGNALEMVSPAKHFYDLGYSVLAPDCRGHGDSEGDYIGMGWHDRLDIIDWIHTIIEKDPDAEIVLYGVSMGGATVMMVSGEELPSNVKCIIEDCGYTSVDDIFTYQLKVLFGLNRFPLIPTASLVTRVRAGYDFTEASAIKQVAKSTTPTMFIHGDEDTFVPFYMLDEVYNAANCEKEKYVVGGAGHGLSATVAGDAYWSRVFDFVDKYLLTDR